MTFWGPSMTELLEKAQFMDGFSWSMSPIQFRDFMNEQTGLKVEGVPPEEAAKKWLKALP